MSARSSSRRSTSVASAARLAVLFCAAIASSVVTASRGSAWAQEPAPSSAQPDASGDEDLFHDARGELDVSEFLDTSIGFVPILFPITEPAVGYGLGGGLAFFHTRPRAVRTPDGVRALPPNATIVGGMGTENESWAAFAVHLHTWDEGRIRYLVGGGYAALNLDWFGQSDAFDGRSFSYEIDGGGFGQKLTFKLGDSDFFLGPTQRFLSTHTRFDSDAVPPLGGPLGITSDQLDATISGLGIVLAYDTRDSMFGPTQGTKATVGLVENAPALGSDFEYAGVDAEAIEYVPVADAFTLGLRGAAAYASEDAPFFDLASIHMRGIEQGRYVDNVALTLESELRYDVSHRWTLVGFGGVGWVADAVDRIDDADGRWAGGAGFRYLIASEYDLRMGLDVARGPEDWALYVTIGTGWVRD